MPCGAALLFDKHTDAAIRGLWQIIEDAGLPSNMLTLGYPPHMTMLTCEDTNMEGLNLMLPRFVASHQPVAVQFHSLGVFAGDDEVIYLAPIINNELLDFHTHYWQMIRPFTVLPNELYAPGVWVPHVTLDLDVPPDLVGPVIELLLEAEFPRQGWITELQVSDLSEDEPVQLFKARLGSVI